MENTNIVLEFVVVGVRICWWW